MGRLKNEIFENLSQQELDELFHKQIEDDAYNYQQWLESDDYINYVNDQLAHSSPEFSMEDITNALDWAKSAINTEPTEIGKDVYDILFIEKVYEHLNKIRYDKF
jgi:response regulator of citrate/malate metabolism